MTTCQLQTSSAGLHRRKRALQLTSFIIQLFQDLPDDLSNRLQGLHIFLGLVEVRLQIPDIQAHWKISKGPG